MEIPPNFLDRRTPSAHTIRGPSHDLLRKPREDVMQNQRYRGSRWRAVATLVLLVFAVTLGRVAQSHGFKVTYRVFAGSHHRVRGHYRDGPLGPLFHFLRKECVATLWPLSDSTKQPSGGSAARFLKYYLNPPVLIGNEPPAGNDSEFTLR